MYLKTMGAYLKSRKVRLAYLKTMGAYFKVQIAKTDKMPIILARFAYKKESPELGGHSVYESITQV